MNEELGKIKQILRPCKPPLWAGHGHLQTIFSHLIPSKKINSPYETHVIKLDDGDELHSKYYPGTIPYVIYLFHGLGGSTDSNYIQRTALVAQKLGLHIFMMNHRGCGIGAGKARNPYHSGRSEDLSSMIGYGKNLFPTFKHIGVGFSLSANALLLLSANVRANHQPDYAIAVNAPINLARASDLLLNGVNKIYDKRFLLDLKQYLLINRPEDIGDYSKIKNLKEFDNHYTAPFGGFKNREDYYARCSANQYLKNINIPTVIISSTDDPFVNIVDYQEAEVSDKVTMHIEKSGGHIGYLSRKGFTFSRWLDYALEQYLKAFIA